MASDIGDAYSEHIDFKISGIVYEDDADTDEGGPTSDDNVKNFVTIESNVEDDKSRLLAAADDDPPFQQLRARGDVEADPDNVVSSNVRSIEVSYTRPSISVDAAGRFATHEIIGGSTVRQKIGEDPVEVSINGVCIEETAKQLDGLRNAKYGTIWSKRLNGEFLDCHFASVSTSPLEDGGAVSFFGKDFGKAESGDFLYTFNLECVEVVLDGGSSGGSGGGSAGGGGTDDIVTT